MKARKVCPALALICGIAGFVLACRLSPVLARAARDGISVPVTGALNRLTAPLPFPAVEPLALALLAALAFALMQAVLRAVAAGSPKPLGRWAAGLGWTALLLSGILMLLWAPARALPAEPLPGPDDAQLAWLCSALIDELNGASLDFPAAGQSLALAPEVAGVPGGAVKAVRYPEWMRAARICGLFMPLTGEAVVDADAPVSLVPFTAVHELMHLTGIADEGAANIAAWNRCLDTGGAFADSARLWALRYAMGMLRRRDEAAWGQAWAKMEGALMRAFQEAGGEASPAGYPLSKTPWLSPGCGDYTALVSRLTAAGVR